MTGLAIARVRRDVVQIGLRLLEMRRPKDMKPLLIHTGRHDALQCGLRVFGELGRASGRIIERVLPRRMVLPMQSAGQVADPRDSAAAC
jgi:hypothetical protein